MQSVERTITVDKPLDLVRAYLADFTNTEEWDPPTRRTVRESGTGGVGTVYQAEFHPHSFTKLLEPLLPLGLKRPADKTEDQMEQKLREL
jgi:hypothetical protein